MRCEPTQSPAPEAIDIPALREKYRHERDKRIIREATNQSSEAAQSAWVGHIRQTAVDISQFQRECTPSYFNGEGSEKLRWYAGETYGPGWVAFQRLLQEWRDKGDLEGLVLAGR